MSVAADLHSLQDMDLAIDRVLNRLREIEDGLEETEELRAARKLKDEKKNIADVLKTRQTELEWEVDDVRTKAVEVEARLYAGTVTNPKELADLDADLKSLKSQTARREDVLLALLVELDEADTDEKRASAAYAEDEGAWRANCDALLTERAKLEPELETLQVSRESRAGTIGSSPLSMYTLLRERKGGVAVARVEQGMCQGCRISLPAAVLQRARGSSELVQCVSCERILLVS
jgi:predicted  nucleic acid-binding Zn-ribbon protein